MFSIVSNISKYILTLFIIEEIIELMLMNYYVEYYQLLCTISLGLPKMMETKATHRIEITTVPIETVHPQLSTIYY